MHSEQIGRQAADFAVVTDLPIDLHGRRSAEGKLEIDLRRKAANCRFSPEGDSEKLEAEIDEAMLAEPARTWGEAMEEVHFLLQRYSATSDAQEVRIQKLIKRALGALARLKEREESNS